jgi:hypothetical protein
VEDLKLELLKSKI